MGTLRPETLAVTAGRTHTDGDAINVPITLTSSFRSGAGPEYARGDGTPTWRALEEAVGLLEGGVAVSFSSGMAAVAAILDQLPDGARLVVPADCYQGVAILVAQGAATRGWKVERLPTEATDRWIEALPGADLCWLESPSNPLLQIADLAAICAAAAEAGVIAAVDNTFATPVLQRPLESGASYSVQSATKFIGGHSDLLCGVVIARDEALAAPIDHHRTYRGATPGALESFLALRGLRTLPIRIRQAQASAGELATRLEDHPIVSVVRYPGLPSHPRHAMATAQLDGPGAMLSFDLSCSAGETDDRLLRLEVITRATSLGGVETLIERRAKLTGQEHLPPSLCRLSVGVEHVDDLWDDLQQMLA